MYRNGIHKIVIIALISLVVITSAKACGLKVNDAFWKSHWYIFRTDLQGIWPKLKADDFNQIKNNQANLLPCLKKRYGTPTTQIRREIYNYYISIPNSKLDDINYKDLVLEIDSRAWAKNWAFIEEELRLRWPDLSSKNLQRIKLNPENLKNSLKQKYAMTQQTALAIAREFIRDISQPLFYACTLSQERKDEKNNT